MKIIFFAILIFSTSLSFAKKLNDIIDPSDNTTPIVLTDDECRDSVALSQNYNWQYIRGGVVECYGDNGKDGPALVLYFIKVSDKSYTKTKFNYQQLNSAIEISNRANMAATAWALEHPLTYPSVPQAQYNYSAPPPPMQIIQPTLTNQNRMTCTPNRLGGFNCQ